MVSAPAVAMLLLLLLMDWLNVDKNIVGRVVDIVLTWSRDDEGRQFRHKIVLEREFLGPLEFRLLLRRRIDVGSCRQRRRRLVGLFLRQRRRLVVVVGGDAQVRNSFFMLRLLFAEQILDRQKSPKSLDEILRARFFRLRFFNHRRIDALRPVVGQRWEKSGFGGNLNRHR